MVDEIVGEAAEIIRSRPWRGRLSRTQPADVGAFLPPVESTELYLGLVHVVDGVEGTRRRMGVARKFAPEFGIASECGISRGRTPDVAREFLRVSAGAAEAGPA